mmetsp:Transcript_125374/g.390333  ORF Transcript_125374/g.390333 Transcript_125374/m.390333 type:complete len:233 (-) Transcript_125374:260-958(-)
MLLHVPHHLEVPRLGSSCRGRRRRRRVPEEGPRARRGRGADALEVVAALERYDQAASGKGEEEAREVEEAPRRDGATAERVAGRSVKARADEHEVGLEVPADGEQHVLEGEEQLGVARRGLAAEPGTPHVPRHVQRVALAGPPAVAPVVPEVAARVEPALIVAVRREVEHARVLLEHALSAVAVVHVPIDYQHMPRPAALHCGSGRNGDVAEEAEAHRAAAFGVVPRRPHDA